MPDLIQIQPTSGAIGRLSIGLAKNSRVSRSTFLLSLVLCGYFVIGSAQSEIAQIHLNKEEALSALPAVVLDGYKTDSEGLAQFEAEKGIHFDHE